MEEEMQIPRRKAAKKAPSKRGDQDEKEETITMKKSEYEELLREKEELNNLVGQIVDRNKKLKGKNTELNEENKELKAKLKKLSKKGK